MTTYYDRVQGAWYLDVLRALHERLRPATYLEVGAQTGGSLRLASCATVAVDPRFRFSEDVVGDKPALHLHQTTSDRYFARHDPTAALGGPVELAFLDGMHLAEFLLRDFANVERHCRANSVIALHDCLPGEWGIATRDNRDPRRAATKEPEWWAGDVWKMLPILARYRPDLHVLAVDCAPTGLVLVTDLDPGNDTLTRRYREIVAECIGGVTEDDFHRFWAEVPVVPAARFQAPEGLHREFWL